MILEQRVYWQSEGVTLYCGDAIQVLSTLRASSIDAIVTSPPYAQQRQKAYGGIDPRRYPVWTANWMMAAEPLLKQNASVLINIREHIRGGQISDYVHKTRLLLRDIGFIECEELVWIKPDGSPLGSSKRPRRSWERILWFGLTGKAYCDTKANGVESQRIGFPADQVGDPTKDLVAGYSEGFVTGISRHRDYVECRLALNERGVDHPARYPTPLAQWLVRGWSKPGSTILDLFMGSGTTGVAAILEGREFVGIDREEHYCAMAQERIEKALRMRRETPTKPPSEPPAPTVPQTIITETNLWEIP